MARGTCEGCHSLDVRQLHRKDLLRPGLWFDWRVHGLFEVGSRPITIQWVGVSARGHVIFMSLRTMNWNLPRSPVSNALPLGATSLSLSGAFCPVEKHDRSNPPLERAEVISSPSRPDPTET
jgi:hypothetical protein